MFKKLHTLKYALQQLQPAFIGKLISLLLAGLFIFMELIINSPTYGTKICFIDKRDYDLIKGFTWGILKSHSGKFYVQHSWKRKGEEVTIKMHRVIVGITDPKIKVDHRDNNPLNNRRNNLRIATASQNSMNRSKTIKNTTGFKGVTFEAKKNRYRALITVKGKTYQGGRFKSVIEAAKRYNELAIIHHGEFAFLNVIPNL